MTRDYSQFFPKDAAPVARSEPTALERLGWQPFFAQQLDVETLTETPPVRVVSVHRNGLHVLGDGVDTTILPIADATVGDWVLMDGAMGVQVLDRKSLFKRRAPGLERKAQLIAANVDTAFIVTSCNRDFNIARLERYIALAFEADVTPIIVLTKADLAEDPDDFRRRAETISNRVLAVTLNALSDAPRTVLADWCKPGQTVAFMGSSGVGKSTLVNALMGDIASETGGLRRDADKGKHTTTRRELFFAPSGCAVMDTPGMRELQMTDAGDGIADLFDDLAALGAQCRFNDCLHGTEPGCAVQAAVAAGEVDPDRLTRWNKLVAEDKFNSASLSERRANDKAFGKMVKSVVKNRRRR